METEDLVALMDNLDLLYVDLIIILYTGPVLIAQFKLMFAFRICC